MEGSAYKTKASVLKRAREAIGKPLKEVDKTGRLETGKGAIGTVIEESWFGYKPNSESEPDFPEAGVELKVIPYILNNKGIRAKERLVCNIIDYMREYDKTFRTSAFWHKCNTMLIMPYEHRYDVPKGDYTIDEAVLFSFPEEDLKIIEQDWITIMEKVRKGQAHLLSEGDTIFFPRRIYAKNEPRQTHVCRGSTVFNGYSSSIISSAASRRSWSDSASILLR